MKKWLLLSNCQHQGLADCLTVLTEDVDVESYIYSQYDLAALEHEASRYDRILLHTEAAKAVNPSLLDHENVSLLPSIYFSGYHPDSTYLIADGKVVTGPMADYHSGIAITAFKLGLSEGDTLRLFSAPVFRHLGYFDAWATDRDALIQTFKEHGYDVGRQFVKWCRRGTFMYTINHPRIEVLMDLAEIIVARFGGANASGARYLPPDYLVAAPIYPVYPEIAKRLSVDGGSYAFKGANKNRSIKLEQFVAASFAAYRSLGSANLLAKGPGFEDSLKAFLEAA